MRVCQINIRGLRANFSDLQTSVSNLYDIICIQETMLSDNVNDDNLKIPGYQKPLRRDRDQNGGGLIIYLSNNIRAKRRPDLESSNNETMWVEMKLKGLAVLLCNCYRPPSAGVEFWDSFQCQLDQAKRTPRTVMRVEFHPASNMAEHGKWRFYGMPIDNIELV